MNRIVLGLSWE